MGENFTPSAASRQYVRQLAAHAPLRIPFPVRFNTDFQEWYGIDSRRVHYSPTAGGDNTIFNRIKSGFPSAVIVNLEKDNADACTPVPLMALGVSVRESADGGTVVHYGLIKDLVEGSSAILDKPTIAIGLASDGRSAWIDFTVDYGDDNPEDGFEKKDLFIDLWNEACKIRPLPNKQPIGKYNETTGYFELNGITDITYEEALEIYSNRINSFSDYHTGNQNLNARTNLCALFSTYGDNIVMCNFLQRCPNLRVARLSTNEAQGIFTNDARRLFMEDSKLEEVIPAIFDTNNRKEDSYNYFSTFFHAFDNCSMLRTIKIKGLKSHVDFHWSSLLSLESINYMVANSANTTAITITVHPDVYAKLTNDTTNAAAAALTADELAQWQQLVTDAAAKNISFVTV